MQPQPAWQTEYLARLVAEYGTVPPPWVLYPTAHRCSICWRMGGGETHLVAWWPWWEQQPWDAAQRLAYFRQWPAPPLWLTWIADAVWNLDLVDISEDEEQAAYATYFEELERQGLGTWADYERDTNDPKWLED